MQTGNITGLLLSRKPDYWGNIQTDPNLLYGSDLFCSVTRTGIENPPVLIVSYYNFHKEQVLWCISSFNFQICRTNVTFKNYTICIFDACK